MRLYGTASSPGCFPFVLFFFFLKKTNLEHTVQVKSSPTHLSAIIHSDNADIKKYLSFKSSDQQRTLPLLVLSRIRLVWKDLLSCKGCNRSESGPTRPPDMASFPSIWVILRTVVWTSGCETYPPGMQETGPGCREFSISRCPYWLRLSSELVISFSHLWYHPKHDTFFHVYHPSCNDPT